MATPAEQAKFANDNMSHNTPDGKPVDHKQVLIDLIAMHHGPQSAMVANSAFKNQEKQIKEAMVDHGKTAEEILGSQGIDLQALANPQKGFFGRWQDNFNKQGGNVTNTDVLGNLLTASKINKSNSMGNPEQSIEKLTQLNQMTESVLPGYRFTQTAEGDFVLQPKPMESRGTSAIQNAKDKRTETVINTIYESNNTRESINNAMNSVGKLESGLGGKVTYGVIKNLDANNPLLEDWQNLKMALTDAQLLSSGPLKGAISDKENEWLAAAAANDNLISVPRARAVLSKLKRAVDVKEKSVKDSYKRIYKEDPDTWDEAKSMSNSSGGNSFKSEEEASAANLKPGTKITINGRPAIWE